MDTKWKRSKKVISVLGWALGVSTLAVCAVANPVRSAAGCRKPLRPRDPEGSYEQSAWFRSEVEEMLGQPNPDRREGSPFCIRERPWKRQ